MLSAVTIDDAAGQPVTLHALPATTRGLQRADGLVGITPPRPVTRARPTAHGTVDQTRWTDGRMINLQGFVLGTDAAAAQAEFRAVAAPMLATLDTGPALLKWTEQGAAGLALQAKVKLAGDVMPGLEPGPNALFYAAQLLAADPRAYSQALTTATGLTLGFSAGGLTFNRTFNITFGGTAGGTVAVNNVGNRPSPPVFRLYGGCTNANIILVGSGKQISLTGNIANGDYLEIDVQARTMKLNGTSTALSYLNPVSTTWFELPTGTSTIQAIATAFDTTARCDVLYRSAYT